jgi:hypothetical protein
MSLPTCERCPMLSGDEIFRRLQVAQRVRGKVPRAGSDRRRAVADEAKSRGIARSLTHVPSCDIEPVAIWSDI